MKKLYMKKFAATLLILTLLFSGCGSNSYETTSPAAAPPMAEPMSPEEAGYGYATDDMTVVSEESLAEATGAAQESGDKRIKRGDISMEINNFDETVAQIENLVSESGGYTEASSMGLYGEDSHKVTRMTLRIPAEKYDGVKESIGRLGRVLSSNESMEDVSGQYYDIEARLERKLLEEERLLAMIDEAVEIVDLIELEKRLSEVRTDIEIYQSRLSNMDGLVSYSTLELHLVETTDGTIRPMSDDIGGRMRESFLDSVSFLINIAEMAIIGLTWIVVPAAAVAVPVLIGLFVFKRSRRK